MFLISPANPIHLRKIYSMILALAKQEGILNRIELSQKQFEDILFCDIPKHFAAIAVIEEKVVGVVLYNFTHHNICFNISNGIYIETMYVEPEFRNKGIGSALFSYVAREAEEKSCSRIECWVSVNNVPVNRFYHNLGCVALNQWVIYKCDKQSIAKLMRKN
ncbi:MAG: GNAT family N-acetyltransferase [Legionella sp.]|nr:GNAT family N-acetyltransferase [Legionella sp.]